MKTTLKDYILNHLTEEPKVLSQLIPLRFFTGKQLKQISDDNYQTYSRCVKIRGLKRDEMYLFLPILLPNYACGKPVEVHIRVIVYQLSTKTDIGFQDLTFEQYEKGNELNVFNYQLNYN